ncbi:MAG: GNAT family N-acetyltransferase [Myxococcota bacterium]
MPLEVGAVRDPAELVPLTAVLGSAFARDAAATRVWFERAGIDQLRLARDGGEVGAGMIRIPMGQAFGGRFVPMCGIAGVAVRADRRRQGIATEMLRQQLQELRDQGFPLTTLYASNQPLYRALGYEQAGANYRGTLRPRDIDVRETEGGGTSIATAAERPEVEALYRDWAIQRPGHLDRGSYVWDRLWHPLDGGQVTFALLWDERRRLEAYVGYSQRWRDDGTLMQVTDAMSRTSRGWRRIWTHLRDASTMVGEIRLSTSPTDPLFVLQPHPVMKVTLFEPWMLRVTDPIAALEARGYAKGQPERLVVRIVDPLMGDQSFTMDVVDGRASVRKGGDPTAKIHTRGLSAMYTGYLSPFEAAALGLVEAGQRSLAAMQALFAGPSPWMRDFF